MSREVLMSVLLGALGCAAALALPAGHGLAQQNTIFNSYWVWRGSGGLFILAFPNDAAGALVICAYSHQLLTFRVARRSRKRESNVRVVGRVVPARNE
jgi:hypothetical protein